MNEVLHLPPWMNGWMVSEARRCGIDAAVMLVPPDNRLSQSGTKLTTSRCARQACRCCTVDADMVDEEELEPRPGWSSASRGFSANRDCSRPHR